MSTTSIIWRFTSRLEVLRSCYRNYAKCPLGGGEVALASNPGGHAPIRT